MTFNSLLEKIVPKGKLPESSELIEAYEHWKHEDHANFAKPFAKFLEEHAAKVEGEYLSTSCLSMTLMGVAEA